MSIRQAFFRWHWRQRGGLLACFAYWVMAAPTFLSLWRYRIWPTPAMTLLTLGAACNAVVTLLNGGRMPTTAPFTRAIWCGTDCEHPRRLLWLGDVFRIGRFWLSIGDLLMLSGCAVGLADWSRRKLRRLCAHGEVCGECGARFDDMAALDRHQQTAHLESVDV